MERRRALSREFNLEAVKLLTERDVAVAQATVDLDVHEAVRHKWAREPRDEALNAEIARLRKEVAKLKMELDILKKYRELLCEGV